MKKRPQHASMPGLAPLCWLLLLFVWVGPGCGGEVGDDDSAYASDDDTAGDDDTSDDDTADDDDAGDDDTEPAEIGPAGSFDESIDVDGMARSYTLFVPQSAVDAMAHGPVPLLFGLHGAGDTGSNFIGATRLTDLAEDNAFVIVGPDGYNHGWFVQSNEGWPGSDGQSSSLANDLALLLLLIDDLSTGYWLDASRIYTVGHSRGAGMSGLCATMSGQTNTALGPYTSPFAAHGVNAGYDPFGGSLSLASSQPKRPLWIIHGTADTGVPYSYGEEFADDLEAAGWDVTFTPIQGAGHNWLWQASYGQTNQDLWDWLMGWTAD